MDPVNPTLKQRTRTLEDESRARNSIARADAIGQLELAVVASRHAAQRLRDAGAFAEVVRVADAAAAATLKALRLADPDRDD